MMNKDKIVMTILGSAGGLAKALLSLLNRASRDEDNPIYQQIHDSTFYLIDYNQKPLDYYRDICPNLISRLHIHQVDLKDTIILRNALKRSETSIVMDASLADTVEILDCCNQLGIHYVNSSLENIYIADHNSNYKGFPLVERIRFFEKYKDEYDNLKAIVCSGMSPGVVQWMAIELMNKYPNEQPLGCFIVEQDTSFFKNQTAAKKNIVYTAWSPECFLNQAIQGYPMFMHHQTPLFFYEQVYDLEFKVTLGDKQFYGCLMAHEDSYSLCSQFNMEGGYLYKINEHTTNLIRSHLDHPDKIWKLDREVLIPCVSPLSGEDLVGVLLVYPDKESYMYHTLSNEAAFVQSKTNAAYFQAACGLYAALAVLLKDSIANGVYYVDELLLNTCNHYGRYLSYYLTDFISGENRETDGLIFDRMKHLRKR